MATIVREKMNAEKSAAVKLANIPHELGWLSASLEALTASVERMQDRLAALGDGQAGLVARLEALATKADVSACLETHSLACAQKFDPAKLAKAMGIVLAAVAAAATAIIASLQ